MSRHPERHLMIRSSNRLMRSPAQGTTRSMRGPVLLASALTVLALSLPACAGPAPTPTQTATVAPTPTATPSASPAEPTGPVLVPEGTAEDNLALFSSVVQAVWAGPQQVTGQAYIDALVAAGFDKSAMQLTPDQTTVGNPAESIQFSVRWGQECLVGQVGPATGAPVSVVVPVLGEGSCLVGSTRPIDW